MPTLPVPQRVLVAGDTDTFILYDGRHEHVACDDAGSPVVAGRVDRGKERIVSLLTFFKREPSTPCVRGNPEDCTDCTCGLQPREPEPRPPIVVQALDEGEIAEFWQGSPLRLYTRAYLKRFCEKNNLTLED
jgi:hypothetical protein